MVSVVKDSIPLHNHLEVPKNILSYCREKDLRKTHPGNVPVHVYWASLKKFCKFNSGDFYQLSLKLNSTYRHANTNLKLCLLEIDIRYL